MADGSKIEWTDATLNPIRARVLPHADPLPRFPRPTPVGWHCEHVSAGCRNCYAERMNRRLGTGLDFKPGHRKNIEIFLDEKTLATPLRWKKPRRIFVCSMTDLFADFVKDEWIDRVFAVMALCPQHVFQCLTKRPEIMVRYFESSPIDRIAALLHNAMYEQGTDTTFERAIRDRLQRIYLEDRKATRARSEAGRRVLHRGDDQPMPEGEGGVSSTGRLPIGGRDDQWQARGDGGASAGVDAIQQPNPAGTDGQSQERGEGRQSAGEPRVGDVQRAEASCNQGAGCEASRRSRVEASQDEVERSRCSRDSATSGGRHDDKGNCGTVLNEAEGSVCDRQSQDLEAYLVWPLPNVWLGVSCEDQETADERIPHLLATPAAIRFLSCEPLLGPIDLTSIRYQDEDAEIRIDATTAEAWVENSQSAAAYSNEADGVTRVNWVIVGGESGPNARPIHPDWVRSLRDQCAAAGVPFFFKQWGEWFPRDQWEDNPYLILPDDCDAYHDTARTKVFRDDLNGHIPVHRVGKHRSGRLLDGVEHKNFPQALAT